MEDVDNLSASSYIIDAFEGIDSHFSEISLIGESGCNLIMKAKRYGKWWFLKAIAPPYAEQGAYRVRLRKEFETLVKFSHPSVISAIGIENVPGIGPCIVMEYVDGLTLAEWLAENPSKRQKRSLFRRIVEAVSYIHSHGVVHRDLKPENIMVTRNGDQVKIIDFGLADSDNSAILKHPAGTRGYISPEQATSDIPDVKNDVYSLGVILDKMDCGYRSIVKKCMMPACKRIVDTDAILLSMHRQDRMPVVAALSVMVVVVITAVGIAYYQADSARNDLKVMAGDNELMKGDIVALNDSITMLTLQNKQLDDRLAETADENKSLMEEHEKNKNEELLKERIFAEGSALIRRHFKASGLKEHIDTLSHIKYLSDDWSKHVVALHNLNKEFIDKNTGDLSPVGKADITYRMTEFLSQLFAPLEAHLAHIQNQSSK